MPSPSATAPITATRKIETSTKRSTVSREKYGAGCGIAGRIGAAVASFKSPVVFGTGEAGARGCGESGARSLVAIGTLSQKRGGDQRGSGSAMGAANELH